MAIDKYEYKVKTEEMLDLMESGAYKRAAEIADTIDWRKVRNSSMLMTVSEIYEMTGDVFKSYEVLNQAYTRETESRNLLNRLCELAIKTGNVDEAIDFYDEFVDIAPKDPTQYILRYKILKARRAPLEQQIEALVKFKRFEYIEEWAYELARKYQEAGMTSECIEECDDLILWFNEGKYVYKAMELKMQYKPLTKSQQERYNHRYERREAVTEEIPDVEKYARDKAENLSVKAKVEAIEKAEPIVRGNKHFVEELPHNSKAESHNNVSKKFDEGVVENKENLKEEVHEKPSLEEEVDKSLQKLNEKGIVQTMNLEDALMSLLHPEEYKKSLEKKAEEERNAEKEATVAAVESKLENVNIPEYAHVLEAIESVIDVNLVNKMVDDANNTSQRFDSDLEELKPEPFEDETEEMPSVEELKAKRDKETEEAVNENNTSEYTEEDLSDFSEEDFDEDEFADYEEENSDLEEDEFADYEEENSDLEGDEFADYEEENSDLEGDEFADYEEENSDLEEDEFADYEEENLDLEEDEFADYEEENSDLEEDEFESYEESEAEELISDIDENTVELQEEEVDMKETKKTTPILPPDIQRLIDEIEGVIPEEPEKEYVEEPEEIIEEPHENMGEVTEQLRIDDDFSDFDEDDYNNYEEENTDLEESEELVDFEEEEADDFSDFEEEEADDFSDFEEEEADDFSDFEEEEADDFSDFEEEETDDLSDFEEEETDDFSDFEEEETDDLSDFEEEEADDLSGFEEEDSLLSLFEEDSEELFDENFDYDDLRNSLEKEFSPVSSSDDDEREIPDEEDDIPDILSATTPLSRKETAKLHATGKTAPIPVGELSDALSMSDTGFVVQGRYDLSAQSGIGTRAGLTEEQKKIFSYFVPVRGMSEQLVDVLEQDKNCTNRQGTSKTGNLLIIGNKGNGKTVLAVDVVKAIQKQRNINHGKVAIVTGESLNKKKISEIFSKLYGGAIIIEKAGKMNEKTIMRLNKAMERETGELLVVLEEQRKPLDRLLSINRDFRRKFTSRLEVPILINDELVTFGQSYAEENGYRIDEMGILALYSRIDSLQREDHFVTIAEVKEVMDEAIAHNQKGAAKKLVKKVFKKNTDNNNRVLLSENDFHTK